MPRGSVKNQITFITLLFALGTTCLPAQGGVHFVDPAASSPTPPYTNWGTAARDIQSAIDISLAGDFVMVTNGVYASGGRVVYGALTNRVVVDRAITVQSVNGPAVTVIQGAYASGSMTGDSAIRCAYMTNGAKLAGFTLAQGATRTSGDTVHELCGGGLWCEASSSVISNCVLTGNLAFWAGGAIYGGSLTNCSLMSNCATQISGTGMFTHLGEGGGAFLATLNGCVLASNLSYNGGGASQCALTACLIGTNSAKANGGGVSYGTLQDCLLIGNIAVGSYLGDGGGGGYLAAMTNCILSRNYAVGGGGTSGGVLDHCTLTNNSARYGGGMYGSALYHCTVIGNSIPSGGGAGETGGGACYGTLTCCLVKDNWGYNGLSGGGARRSTLINCIVTGNSASSGAGASDGVLINCTVTANVGYSGGGVMNAVLTNCIVYANTATAIGGGSNFYYDAAFGQGKYAFDHCCTAPLPAGFRNITNPPVFIDLAGGNLRLQSNSPCINAGFNGAVTNTPDIDGNPRIAGDTVDIGAYEFQSPASKLSYAWLQQYGFPLDGSADLLDADGDAMNNWQEWRAGTNPTNSSSVLRILSITKTAMGAAITWQSVAGQPYYVEISSYHANSPNDFAGARRNVTGLAGTTTLTNNFMDPTGPFYFRVSVP